MNDIDVAFKLAAEVCAGKFRDGGIIPAIQHPIGVMSNLIELAGCQRVDLICVALLHDVIEDGPVETRQDVIMKIAFAFGEDVSMWVAQLTLPDGLSYPEKTQHLVEFMREGPPEAILVKLCDRLHNLSTMGVWDAEHQARYKDQTNKMLDALDLRLCEKKAFEDKELQRSIDKMVLELEAVL